MSLESLSIINVTGVSRHLFNIFCSICLINVKETLTDLSLFNTFICLIFLLFFESISNFACEIFLILLSFFISITFSPALFENVLLDKSIISLTLYSSKHLKKSSSVFLVNKFLLVLCIFKC